MAPDLSVVIPLCDEEPNVAELHRELTAALGAWGRSYELLFIDDGSTDGTFPALQALQAGDPRVRVIAFRRNFGQTAAFAAGFAHARGRVIATSDGDLQNDPRDLPMMFDRLHDGYDIVCGWRRERRDPWLTRRVPSHLANWLISRTTGVRLHDYGCSLKVFRCEVVRSLRLYGEMHRFIPAIASEQGVRIAEVEVRHRPRRFGASKYGLSRTMRVVLDLFTVKFLLSYATQPIQIFGPPGLLMGAAGAAITGYLGYARLFGGQGIGDRPLLLLGILLIFAGLQFLTLGLLAELQARTYHESQGKPIYAVREILEGAAAAGDPADLRRRPAVSDAGSARGSAGADRS